MKYLLLFIFILAISSSVLAENKALDSSRGQENKQKHPSLDQNRWKLVKKMPHIFSLFPEFQEIRDSKNKFVFTFQEYERNVRYHKRRVAKLMLSLKTRYPDRYGSIEDREILAIGLNHDEAKTNREKIFTLYEEYLKIQKSKIEGYKLKKHRKNYHLIAFEALVEELATNQVFRQHYPTDSLYSYFPRVGSLRDFKLIVKEGSKEYFKLDPKDRQVQLEDVQTFLEQADEEDIANYPNELFSTSYLKNFTIGERLFIFFGVPYNELPLLLKWQLHNSIHFLNFADNYFTLEVLKELRLASGHSFETARISPKALLLLEMELISDKVDRALDPIAEADEFRRAMELASRYLQNPEDQTRAAFLEQNYDTIVEGFRYKDHTQTAPLETCVSLLSGQVVRFKGISPNNHGPIR